MFKKILKEIGSWILSVGVPVGIVLLLNLFVCKLAVVTGDSMNPTLLNRDLLVVRLVGEEPKTGDIVVVNSPEESYVHGEKLVKRVIASGGQTVRIDYEANKVYVDGVALEEPYLNYAESDPMLPMSASEEIVVPADSLYVLGDNRNHSGDSRHPEIGVIGPEDIIGVSVARIPFGRWIHP